MNRFARWLLGLTAAAGGLLVVLLALSLWILFNPGSAWRLAQRHFLPQDLQVTWEEIHWRPARAGWLHWNFDWQVKNLRIEKASPKISVPIDEIALEFSLSLFEPSTRVDFAKVALRAGQTIRVQSSDDSPHARAERSPYEWLEHYLSYVEWGRHRASMRSIDVSMRELVYLPASGGEPLHFSAVLYKAADEKDPDSLKLDFQMQSKSLNAALKGALNAAEMRLEAKLQLDGLHLKEDSVITASFSEGALSATRKGPLAVILDRGKRPLRLNPDVNLLMDERQAVLRITSEVNDIPGPVTRLEKVEARFTLPFQNGSLFSDSPSSFSFNGPVEFAIGKDLRPKLEASCRCRMPEHLATSLSGKAWLKTLQAENPSYKRPFVQARLAAERMRNSLFSLDLAVGLEISRYGNEWIWEPSTDSELVIHSFKGIRDSLDSLNVPVPAPFDVLDGTIQVTAKSPVKRDGGRSQIPVKAKVLLGSEHQKVDVESEMVVDLAPDLRGASVQMKFLVNTFQVELPPLDPILGLPKLARDERVELEPPSPSPGAPPKFKLSFYFELKTAQPGTIRLLSKYAVPAVPITVSAHRAVGGDLLGTVQLEPFDVRYLRRTVHVDSLRVLLGKEDSPDFSVDGRMRVDQTQYRIFIDISGTMRSPSVILTSEPYLPRSEIISVLLYDRTSDQLVSGDAEMAGNFEAAMADRAIGLFGLWALASTPIKSFSYNPVTKVYAATVQLADGLSAGIGTNWEEATQLEVRKRVSKRWVLTASWGSSGEAADRSQVGKLVLQWEKRF